MPPLAAAGLGEPRKEGEGVTAETPGQGSPWGQRQGGSRIHPHPNLRAGPRIPKDPPCTQVGARALGVGAKGSLTASPSPTAQAAAAQGTQATRRLPRVRLTPPPGAAFNTLVGILCRIGCSFVGSGPPEGETSLTWSNVPT